MYLLGFQAGVVLWFLTMFRLYLDVFSARFVSLMSSRRHRSGCCRDPWTRVSGVRAMLCRPLALQAVKGCLSVIGFVGCDGLPICDGICRL